LSRRGIGAISQEREGPTRALLSEEMPLIIREATEGGGPKFLLTVVFPGMRGRVHGGGAPRVIQRGGGRMGFLGIRLLAMERRVRRRWGGVGQIVVDIRRGGVLGGLLPRGHKSIRVV